MDHLYWWLTGRPQTSRTNPKYRPTIRQRLESPLKRRPEGGNGSTYGLTSRLKDDDDDDDDYCAV